MPTLNQSAVTLDPNRWQQQAQQNTANAPGHAPVLGDWLTMSSVLISSMPTISTTVDGITRQFYGPHNLPLRRITTP